jgi:hypothetical protein
LGGERDTVEGSDILQTLAEVAIALTGFTGIVAALRSRTDKSLTGYVLVRFRILLVASLAAVTFALLPFLFHHLGASPSVTWSACSAAVAAIMVPIAIHDTRAFRTYSDVMPKLDRRVAPLVAFVGSALLIFQVANVFVLHAFGPYLVMPMWFLGFSGFQFCRLLLAVEHGEGQ